MSNKILIAEDSSVILNLTKKILEQELYEIDTAKNGQEVLDKLRDKHYDLILMDINMPKLNGIECTKRIRSLEDETKSGTPIFAITGNAPNYSKEDFKRAGINEYLQKPLDFDVLVHAVKNYTNQG